MEKIVSSAPSDLDLQKFNKWWSLIKVFNKKIFTQQEPRFSDAKGLGKTS